MVNEKQHIPFKLHAVYVLVFRYAFREFLIEYSKFQEKRYNLYSSSSDTMNLFIKGITMDLFLINLDTTRE